MMATSYAGVWQFQADLAWAGLEYASKLTTAPLLHMLAPSCETGRPVMTFPGFMGPERSLAPLNRFLNSKGYAANPWGLGTNWGFDSMTAMRDLIDTLVE
ncbi:MAG: hypothetical protein AAF337_13710, partial [Pseudomonadota bacterium]